jgi:branched-chain amino acid aminotransferase
VAVFDDQLASLDGEIMRAGEATIPATDDGLLRGDGIFEVVHVYPEGPFRLEAHFARLARSAANLRLDVDLESVRAETHRLLAQAGTGVDRLLRIVVTRGGRRLMLTEPMPATPERIRLCTMTYAPPRLLDGIKSLSYAPNMLATRLAAERGFDDALLVSPHGRVLEAPRSSFFWVRDGELLTPPLDDHVLASITRALVIEVTGASERSCSLEDLAAAAEMFIASTVREVQPLSVLDERSLDAIGPVTTRTQAAVSERIAAELAQG